MSRYTDCDLSAGIAKLDIPALTEQMEIHYHKILLSIAKEVEPEFRIDSKKRREHVFKMSCTGVPSIQHLVNSLSKTSELLHTLHESDTRSIELIRKEPSDG